MPTACNHDNFYTYVTDRPQKQERLDGSKFLDIGKMNHELKFGFGYRNTPVNSSSVYPGPAHGWWDYFNVARQSVPLRAFRANCGIATVGRDVRVGYAEKYNDFYVGDTILMGNLTLQGGLRWDRQQSQNTAISIAANPILATPLTLPCSTTFASSCTGGTLNAQLPPVNFAGDPRPLKWNTRQPAHRYDLQPRRRQAHAASRRLQPLCQPDRLRRVAARIRSAGSCFYFLGVDTNGDHVIQRNELPEDQRTLPASIRPIQPRSH